MKYGNQLSEAYREMSQGDVFRQKAIPMRILKIIRSAFDATFIPCTGVVLSVICKVFSLTSSSRLVCGIDLY